MRVRVCVCVNGRTCCYKMCSSLKGDVTFRMTVGSVSNCTARFREVTLGKKRSAHCIEIASLSKCMLLNVYDLSDQSGLLTAAGMRRSIEVLELQNHFFTFKDLFIFI